MIIGWSHFSASQLLSLCINCGPSLQPSDSSLCYIPCDVCRELAGCVPRAKWLKMHPLHYDLRSNPDVTKQFVICSGHCGPGEEATTISGDQFPNHFFANVYYTTQFLSFLSTAKLMTARLIVLITVILIVTFVGLKVLWLLASHTYFYPYYTDS